MEMTQKLAMHEDEPVIVKLVPDQQGGQNTPAEVGDL